MLVFLCYVHTVNCLNCNLVLRIIRQYYESVFTRWTGWTLAVLEARRQYHPGYHWLLSRVSRVNSHNSQWLSLCEPSVFDPPQHRRPLTDHPKICHRPVTIFIQTAACYNNTINLPNISLVLMQINGATFKNTYYNSQKNKTKELNLWRRKWQDLLRLLFLWSYTGICAGIRNNSAIMTDNYWWTC